MKRFLSLLIFTLTFSALFESQAQAQTTVTFDEITTNTALSLNGTNTYDNSGVKFQIFSGSNSGARVSSAEGGFNGTRALDDTNLDIGGVTGWKIRKVDGTAFQLLSIWLKNGYSLASASGTIKAYKSGAQVGATVDVTFDSNTTGAKNFAANPDFYDIDEIRIEGTDLYVLIDNFSFGAPLTPVDTDPPLVTSISLVGTPLTTATSVNYSVTFSKAAKNVSSDDFQLTTAGTIGTVGAVSGSGSAYTVAVNGIDGEGTIRLDLKGGTDIANVDDNTGTPAFTSGQLHYVGACFVETFETETDAATSFSGNGVNFSLGTGFEIERRSGFGAGPSGGYVKNNNTAGSFSFSSASEFTMSTVDLFLSDQTNGDNPTATGTVSITGKKGGVDQYTITKSTGFPTTTAANNGFFTVNFATDGAGNYRNTNVDELVFTISGGFIELAFDNLKFCEAAPEVDAQAPVVQSITIDGNPISTASSINFTVIFDEDAVNVTLDDFTLLKTGTATGALSSISGSGTSYTLGITGISGEGSIQVKLNAATDIADGGGNTPPFEYLNGEIHLVGACYIENFESFANGATSFSSNGKTITLGGNWAVKDKVGFGINSSNGYLENTGSGPFTLTVDAPVQFSKLALFLTSEVGSSPNPTDDGTVTIRGKNGTSTAFEISKTTGFPTDFSSNMGFFYIDFATDGAGDYSNTYVEALEIEIGGSFIYLALDNLQFCSDFDAPSGYTVSIDQDPITIDNESNISFTFADAEIGTTYSYSFISSGGAGTVTGGGTIATATDQITGINLSGLSDGTITLTVTLTDPSDNTGPDATDTSEKAPNNAPVATPPTAPVVFEDDTNVALADDIEVEDIDGNDQTLTFTITGGTLSLGTTGITFGGLGNGSASFTATGTLAAINTALDAATFTPTPNLFGTNAGTIAFVSNDGALNSNSASVSFTITGVNDAPVVDQNGVSIADWTEGASPTVINTAILVSDPEDDNITSATISVVDFVTGDVLGITTPSPFSSSYNTSTGVLSLSGTGSAAQMQAALRTVVFSNSTDDPGQGNTDNSRAISFYVTDANSATSSTIGNIGVAITSVNDDPTVSDLPTDISVVENTASNVDLSAATFDDPDAGSNDITLELGVSTGTLAASDADGVTVAGSGTVTLTLTGTASEIDTYLNTASNIKYTGPVSVTGEDAATLTLTANDGGNTGTGGGTDVLLGTVNIDILNAQPSVTLSLSPTSKAENLVTDNTVTATLSNTFTSAVTINLSFSGTASNTTDYTRSGSSIVIPVGELTGTIVINNVNDDIYEGDETVIVDISSVTNGLENGVQKVTYTITEDDPMSIVTLSSAESTLLEDAGTATVRATLSAIAGIDVTVPLTTSGTATITVDYSLSPSSILIPAGSTFGEAIVTAIADGIEEGNEDVIVTIGTPINAIAGAADEVSFTILDEDSVDPDTPSTPDLSAVSDTGVSDADNITSDNTPTFTGTAEANATVEVFSGGASIGTTPVNGAGNWSFTPGVSLADGTFDITATAIDAVGNTSDPSEPLSITIDTTSPLAPGTPDLLDTSDSGISDTDNITNDVTPSIEGTAEVGSSVVITSSIDGDLGAVTVDGLGQWSFTPGTDMSTGVHSITVTATDVAGNTSVSSASLSLTIDTLAPTPILINNLTIQLDLNGTPLTVNLSDLLASPITDDFSGSADVDLSLDSSTFDCSNVGSNQVTVTATDEAGNSDFALTNITVQDNIGPDIQAKASITLNVEAFGTATLLPAMIDEGSTDACGILTKAFSQSAFDRTHEGLNNVTYTVTDVNGNPASVTIAVTIVVVPKVLTIVADAGQLKVYGQVDPVFTYTASGFENGDDETILTGVLTRASGENVGDYAIQLGTLDAGSNYTINFTGAVFTIGTKSLSIVADAGQSKVYGQVDPVFTYTASGFESGDDEAILTGVLTRASGENVGDYAIQLGTLAAGSNYTINITSANFIITSRALVIVANPNQAKVYGNADPVFSFTASNFGNGDTQAVLTGALDRTAGEDIGNYPINLGDLSAGSNYTIDFTSALFTISAKVLNVTSDSGLNKIFGSTDPAFTYTVTGFVNGDTDAILSGSLARASGENVGNYAINLGSLQAGENYAINFVGANFTITKAAITTITLSDGSFIYDGTAKSLVTTGTLPAGTNVAYTNNSRTDVGMQQVTATISGSNYTTLVLTADLTITKAAITTITLADGSFIYDGTAKSLAITGTLPAGTIVAYANNSRTDVGMQQVTATISGSNYTTLVLTADLTITKAAITTITLADGSFIYDGTAKSLAITGTLPAGTIVAYANNSRTDVGMQQVTATISGSNYTTLVLTADLTITKAAITTITLADGSFIYDGTAKSLAITGTLPAGTIVAYTNNSRTDVGMQQVTATISGSNFNYFELTAELEITPASLAIEADEGQSKLFGAADPVLTYTSSGFGDGDDESMLSGVLGRELGETVGTYAINIGTLEAGGNYKIDFTGADFEIISTDTDGDGVPDDVENEQNTDPTDPMDYLDEDGDGVPDYIEEQQGTEPTDPGDYLDSDGDDVPDYVEVQQGSDPKNPDDFLDEEIDGIPDYVQIRSIVEFVDQNLEALWGTQAADLKLPTEVVVITAQGEFINLAVTWDLTGYDPLMSGTTNYMGIVKLPAGLFNLDELQPMLEITVLAKPAPVNVTLSANSFIAIPDQYFQEIGAFTVIDPADNIHNLSLVDNAVDNQYFEVIDGILFWSSAEQAVGRTNFTILLRVTDRAGNILDKNFEITRERTPLDQLDVPNTFTPNGDGVNDSWSVLALRYYQGVRITVLSVGGDRVFYTENPDVVWDGVLNGKEVPVGSYLFVIEVGETGEIRRGMLNLIRQ
ncbi:MBG domain-containing protein [Algoriphagus sp. C2-6-M1]|uniref:MBG domain-containing protein n=1 Tax=Algoriphagus persicinus TaxID=3108754 RepID=UPI002B3EA370|nr:MBG domain-containing protein [Algoriphagus sp. C2-6-M1]MEB2779835.1 MBG domain-containing protein [Algoriphagus sp. C2-6-M1]